MADFNLQFGSQSRLDGGPVAAAAQQHFGIDRKRQSCHAPQAGLSQPGDVLEVRPMTAQPASAA